MINMHSCSLNAYRWGFSRLLLIILLFPFILFQGRCHPIQHCCLIQRRPLAVSLRVLWPAMLCGLFFMRAIILLALAATDSKMESSWLTPPPFWCSHMAAMLYWHRDNKTVCLWVLSGRFISSNHYVLLSQEGAHHAALIAEMVLNIRSRHKLHSVHSLIKPSETWLHKSHRAFIKGIPPCGLFHFMTTHNANGQTQSKVLRPILLHKLSIQFSWFISSIPPWWPPTPPISRPQLRLHGVIFTRHRDAGADECQQHARGCSRSRRAPLWHQITPTFSSTGFHLALTRAGFWF